MCFVFLKQEKNVTSLHIELSCAVYLGHLRVGILPAQQDLPSGSCYLLLGS